MNRKAIKSLQAQLKEWQSVFETSEPSHAQARLGAAENQVESLHSELAATTHKWEQAKKQAITLRSNLAAQAAIIYRMRTALERIAASRLGIGNTAMEHLVAKETIARQALLKEKSP